MSDEPRVWQHEGDWYFEDRNGVAVCCNSRQIAEHLAELETDCPYIRLKDETPAP